MAPSRIVQQITSASVLDPREMVKVPAIGKALGFGEKDTRHVFCFHPGQGERWSKSTAPIDG